MSIFEYLPFVNEKKKLEYTNLTEKNKCFRATEYRVQRYISITLLAQKLMQKHGLDDWDFVFVKTKSAVGICKHNKKQICFSKTFNYLPWDEIIETILHEIAHALARKKYGFCQGHNKKWKEICYQIGSNGEK